MAYCTHGLLVLGTRHHQSFIDLWKVHYTKGFISRAWFIVLKTSSTCASYLKGGTHCPIVGRWGRRTVALVTSMRRRRQTMSWRTKGWEGRQKATVQMGEGQDSQRGPLGLLFAWERDGFRSISLKQTEGRVLISSQRSLQCLLEQPPFKRSISRALSWTQMDQDCYTKVTLLKRPESIINNKSQ